MALSHFGEDSTKVGTLEVQQDEPSGLGQGWRHWTSGLQNKHVSPEPISAGGGVVGRPFGECNEMHRLSA